MKIQATFSLFLTIMYLMFGPFVYADDDRAWGFWKGDHRNQDVAPVDNSLYQEECGGCHFAFQPGLLPKRSWQKIMKDLDKHFGDNAELDPGDLDRLLTYLERNAADVVNSKFARWASGGAPMRITETSKFRHEHDEFPRSVLENPKVKSLSNCIACHKRADTGSYDENQIKIPGIGRWDD